MAKPRPLKPAKKGTDDCTIPPELPKEQLHKLMFRQSEEEAQAISSYVAWQSREDGEKVLHAEKVASERVMGRDFDVWDVHTDGKEDGRWWGDNQPNKSLLATSDAEHGLCSVISYRPDDARRSASRAGRH